MNVKHDINQGKRASTRHESPSKTIKVLSYVRGSAAERQTGLIGFLSVEYCDLIVDSLVLRMTGDGRYALSFPAKTDRSGTRHPYYRPIDHRARVAIERAILDQLAGELEAIP